MVFYFDSAINAFRARNQFFDLNQTGRKPWQDAQSWAEYFVDCLSRYLSLPGSGEAERDHGDETARLLHQNVPVQNDK